MLTSTGNRCSAESIPTTSDSACTKTLTGSGTITVFYSADTELLYMEATLPQNSFAGWGWGATMVDTEMLIFSASTVDGSSITTYYSSGKTTPDEEPSL